MLFASKAQAAAVVPQAASSVGHPPGLRLIQRPTENAAAAQIVTTLSGPKQRNTDSAIVPQNQAAANVLMPILPAAAEKDMLQATKKLSPLDAPRSKPDGMLS